MTTLELNTKAPSVAQSRAAIHPAGEVATGDRRPPLFVPRDEIEFWTRRWVAGEDESAAERAAGNLRIFDNGSDLLDWLRQAED